jgi:hypothetical protein
MQSPARRSLLQHIELMPQHQDLGFQLLSRLEVVAQHADEQEPDCNHAAIMFRFAADRDGFRKRQAARMWVYHNPVKIEFGAGAIARLGEHIAGRRWALVTYDLPVFRDLGATIGAGPPVAIIDNIVTNPDVRDLAQSCRQYADVSAPPEVIVALGGGLIIETAKVLAAAPP